MHIRRRVPSTTALSAHFSLIGMLNCGPRVFLFSLGYDSADNDYVFQHLNKNGFDLRKSADVASVAR